MRSVKIEIIEDQKGLESFISCKELDEVSIELLKGDQTHESHLIWTKEGLFFQPRDTRLKPIQFSFDLYFEGWKKQGLGKSTSLLLKAFRNDHHILDCSCGTGKDTSQLLFAGHDVSAFEKDPNVFLLLLWAKKHCTSPLLESLELYFGDAFELAQRLEVPKIDSMYYDPMFFSHLTKSLPRKEMQIFRELIKNDEAGYQSCIKEFCLSITSKLVVKRSLKQESLFPKPSYQLKGKTIRLDVYR